jgi:methionyl-tRNA formyltransferase
LRKGTNVRLIVMGTGPFATPSFRALLQSEHQVLALVTRPIADPGRRKSSANPMRDEADARHVEVLAPANVNDAEFVAELRRRQSDLFVVCDFGQILSAECLAAAQLGGINLHGSLLPKYRGAAPVQWAVYHGDSVSGVSVIHMTPRLDGGPILTQIATPLGPDETTEQLEDRLAQLGIEAVLQAIELLQGWDGVREIGQRQDPGQMTRAPRLKKEQGLIDWSLSANQIRNQIRAFTPWPGSFTHLCRATGEPLRVILHTAQVETDFPAADPGTIVAADESRLVVACGQNALSLFTVQPAGKRSMSIAEFLRGNPVQVGGRLA